MIWLCQPLSHITSPTTHIVAGSILSLMAFVDDFYKVANCNQIKTKFTFLFTILPKRTVWVVINNCSLNLFSFIFTLSAVFSPNLFTACFFVLLAFVASFPFPPLLCLPCSKGSFNLGLHWCISEHFCSALFSSLKHFVFLVVLDVVVLVQVWLSYFTMAAKSQGLLKALGERMDSAGRDGLELEPLMSFAICHQLHGLKKTLSWSAFKSTDLHYQNNLDWKGIYLQNPFWMFDGMKAKGKDFNTNPAVM